MRKRLSIMVAVAGIAAFAALGSARANSADTVVLTAKLTGRYLHTTSTGHGTARITFTASKVCWRFTYTGLDRPNVSGIHVVPPPAAGKHTRSVFPFSAATSRAPGCVAKTHWGPSSAGWADKIVANPAHFYVIIGTSKYPQGAIGGVLHGA